MPEGSTWLAALATVAILLAHEAAMALAQRQNPHGRARSTHARLSEEWFAAISAQPGSELMAVQTLRNALMSAAMTASTAVLACQPLSAARIPSITAR